MNDLLEVRNQFFRRVETHRMKVLHDDGIRRHLRFDRNGSSIDHFEIITWPGFLCYAGDMGCFVFSRVQDMFTFFRQPRGEEITINPSYWSQKVQAVDKCDGIKEYSAEKARRIIEDILAGDEDATDDLRAAVEEEVLSAVDDGIEAFRDAVASFRWQDQEYFTDFWENDLTAFTYRFLFCCFAVVWAVRLYDTARLQLPEAGK